MDDSDRAIHKWLSALPLKAEIAWNADELIDTSKLVFARSIDIQIPMLEKEMGLNWIWTIHVEGDWPHDWIADALIPKSGDALIIAGANEQLELALACKNNGTNTPLNADEISYLCHEASHKIGSRTVWIRPYAYLTSVNEALVEIAAKAGRADLAFRFAPEIGPSEEIQKVIERIERLKSGETAAIPMELDSPEWISDFFGISIGQAEENVRQMKIDSSTLRNRNEQIRTSQRKRAKELMKRLGLKSI